MLGRDKRCILSAPLAAWPGRLSPSLGFTFWRRGGGVLCAHPCEVLAKVNGPPGAPFRTPELFDRCQDADLNSGHTDSKPRAPHPRLCPTHAPPPLGPPHPVLRAEAQAQGEGGGRPP